MRIGPRQVWRRPTRNLGYAEGLRGRGGIACPLLAGFALAAIAQLSTADHTPPLAAWSMLAFAASVAVLLHSMQLAFFALAADPAPTTFLAWHPEALVDEQALRDVRRRQIAKYQEMISYWKKSNITYDAGLNAFLCGVVLLLVPNHWSGPRIAAVAVAGAALLLEAWWGIANRVSAIPHPVEGPGKPLDEVDELDVTAMAAVLDPDRLAEASIRAQEASLHAFARRLADGNGALARDRQDGARAAVGARRPGS